MSNKGVNKSISKSINHIKKSRSKSHKVVKRGAKGKDCIYFDSDNKSCTKTKTFCNFCNNFTPIKKDKLSEYDEDYIQIPLQSWTHDSTKEYIGLSKQIGTPVHVGYLKSNDKRRHKARCIFYDKLNKLCTWYKVKCKGSSHCDKYEEIDN